MAVTALKGIPASVIASWAAALLIFGAIAAIAFAARPRAAAAAAPRKAATKKAKKAAAPPPQRAAPSSRPLPPWLKRGGAIILDANNVRGAIGFEADLVDLGAIARRARRLAPDVEWIVCVDHGPRHCALDCGDVVLSFSGPKFSQPYACADDMIVSDVGRLCKLGCKAVCVVTSDRQLRKRRVFSACHASAILLTPRL